MQATRHSPGTFSEPITLIARLYDRIDTLEAEKKTAAEQFETQLKAAHENNCRAHREGEPITRTIRTG